VKTASRWFYKYKIYHLPFWFGYNFLWWTLRLGSPMAVFTTLGYTHAAVKFLFYLVFQMAGVYFNLYFLVPRFLEKGRYITYIALLLSTIICSASCIVSGYYIGALLSGKTVLELYGVAPGNYYSLFESGALPSTIAAMTLAMSIKLTRNWLRARRKEKLLEMEKLETELKFLKSQFNPHFLFNTINSIFVLISKNPKMASESLVKFSDLLRYQLYECNEQQIPLVQELGYLDNFIELEKLRQDGNQEWKFEIDNPGNNQLTIAPFILMPFVENAFKHVSQQKQTKNWIHMELKCRDHQLHFTISNSTDHHSHHESGMEKYRGIGLKNVQRRLDLIYPEMHSLNIQRADNQFRVELILTVSAREGSPVKLQTRDQVKESVIFELSRI
jgi:two-component system, LytTR family, sensor kinase